MKTEKPDTYCLSVAYMARRKVKLGFFLLLVTLAGYSYIPASRAAEPKPRYGRVLVVANRLSPASLELASQYCRRRLIPPANILKLSFADQINISPSAFREKMLKPIRERYRKLDEVPDYVVLVRGVPYRTGRIATTTAILFNGSENLRPIHGYFQRLETFDSSIPYFGELLLPATVLSAYNVQEGMELIKRSEVVYPNPADAGTFYFCDGAGPRGSRNRQIESAMAQLQGEGVKAEHVKHPSLKNRHDVLAQLTGNTRLSLESNTYLPGSIIDNMTSWGGYLLGKKPHNSALTFIAHGACGAYGTVYEPTNNPRRWAAYTLPLSYARGFNLAESYLQNVRDLKFGTVVGDPLTRPFGKPAKTNLKIRREPRADDSEIMVDIDIKEGVSGEGISHAEIWLDGQHKILEWTPVLPAATTCKLVIERNGESLLVRRKTFQKNVSLPQAIAAFREQMQDEFEINLAGRQRNKLLVRWKPKNQVADNLICKFIIQAEDRQYVRSSPLPVRPILMKTAVLNFGAVPPQEGDTVELTIGGEKRQARCVAGESFEHFTKRLKQYIEASGKFNSEPGYKVFYDNRENNQGKKEHKLVITPKKPLPSEKFKIAVEISTSEQSSFARALSKKNDFWALRQMGALGEAVLAPLVPVSRLTDSLRIPTDKICAGAHKLTVHVTTPRGARSHSTGGFFLPPPTKNPEDVQLINLPRTHFNLGDKMIVGLSPPPGHDESYPLLVIDNQPIRLWNKAARIGSFKFETPLMAPGAHDLWVEWITQKEIPDARQPRQPVMRSRSHKIWIRRPVNSELTWSPKKCPPNEKVTLKLRGPYLREGLMLLVGDNVVRLERKSKDGLTFTADLPPLATGQYKIVIMGDKERESDFQLSPALKVETAGDTGVADVGFER